MARFAAVFGVAVLLPVVASAQAVISGVVRDASGAVLPGVTVEAASPALIEKVRTTVTDGTGQYAIENLRPGVYTVDLRVSKLLSFGGTRLRVNADLYNALNSSAVLEQNDAFDDWLTPSQILVARFFKFSVQFDF